MISRLLKTIFHSNNAFPGAIAFLYCGMMLSLHGFSNTILYAYSDKELLNALFANPVFIHNLSPDMQTIYYPWQNLNCLSWFVLYLTNLIAMPSLSIGAQIVLSIFFVYRLMRILNHFLSYQESYLYFILFFSHPLVWINLITTPSTVLTLWLFFECIYHLFTQSNHFRVYCAFILLSFSGLLGFVSAILIALIAIRMHYIQTSESRETLYIVGFALIPAVTFYCLISFYSQFLGGPFIPKYMSPTAYVSFANWINGVWTNSLQSLIYYSGNGFLDLGYLFPVFGLLAILGFVANQENSQHVNLTVILQLFTCLLLFLFSFFPFELITSQLLLLYAVMLWFVVGGIKQIILHFNIQQKGLTIGILIILALINLVHFPIQWKPILQRAMYYESIQFNYHEFMNANPSLAEHSFPMRFSPVIFSNLPDQKPLQPFALNIVPNNTNTILPNLFLTLPQDELPQIIFEFAPFNFAQQQGINAQPDNLQLKHYRDYYSEHRIQNLVIYHQLKEPGLDDPPYKRLNQELIGQQWHFNDHYEHTQQVGLAFGTKPSYLNTAVSYGSAGPNSLSADHLLGEFSSLPFVIEGDELQIVANMPQNSTQSILCLAIYDEQPIGHSASIKEAKHIYEHQPQDALTDDVFYYINPNNLNYSAGLVKGWRVVRFEHSGNSGWQYINWSIDPWKNKQAMWLAADRDSNGSFWIDQITQHKRSPGYYWNFEQGIYDGWQITGTAMGTQPAQGLFGNQSTIRGVEGNFFVNSFFQGSDIPIGSLTTPTLPITLNRLSFLIGGGNDVDLLYLALMVDGEIVLKATGQQDEVLRRHVWDLTPWIGKQGQLVITDQSSGAWGHILVDDIRMYNEKP